MKRSVKKKRSRNPVLRTRAATNAYEKDFYNWTRAQANFLKNEELDKLDIRHLIEEIESLGNSEKRALESHISNLFLHLLKIKHQPSMRSKSWENSVKNATFQIKKILKANPSLKSRLKELTRDAYYIARLNASSETGLDESVFPKNCPWEMVELLG